MSSTNSTVEFDSLHRLSQTLRGIPEGSSLPDSLSEASSKPPKSPAQLYFNSHPILEHIENVVNELAITMPSDPYSYLEEYFKKLRVSSKPITERNSNKKVLSVQVFSHDTSSPQKSQIVETKLPANEVDHKFASYLSNLASSVRRGTS